MERQTQYDCRTCRLNNWIEKQHRVCFLDNKEQEIPFPKFITMDDNGNAVKPYQLIENGQHAVSIETCTTEGIYDWLRYMSDIFPVMPSFEVLMTFLKPVCIESIIDPYVYHMFALESSVEAYGVGALDLRQDLFTMFEAIRSSSNMYENLQAFKTEQEAKNMALNNKGKR